MRWIGSLRVRWARISLSARFLIASALAICLTMLLTSAWVENQLRTGVVRNAAASSARIMEAVIGPHIQDIATTKSVSIAARQAIASLSQDGSLGRRILQIKIWLPDGTLVYANGGGQAGSVPEMTKELSAAIAGEVSAHFDDTGDAELAEERKHGIPLFEIYTPIYRFGSKTIIAIAEFYEDATILRREFDAARWQSLLILGTSTFTMLAFLFSIVHRANLLIRSQQEQLQARITQQTHLLEQNASLRSRVRQAHQDVTTNTEKFLRRVGADLHDGPAQLLTAVLMRLHELVPKPGWEARRTMLLPGDNPFDAVQSATQEALAEIRSISAGVSLPQLEHRGTIEVLELAIGNHERRTGSVVKCRFGAVPPVLPLAQKICLYRCTQEGLNNAFRHAGGKGQSVGVEVAGNWIVLTVMDFGPGFSPTIRQDGRNTLGLEGMRHRVEALEGEFEISSLLEQGTIIRVSLPLESTP